MKACSIDLRQKVVSAVDRGEANRAMDRQRFGIRGKRRAVYLDRSK